jgi:formylglycine-generating enzyme required for sulfatase activity/serine/threonine protein kinase
MKEEEFFKRYTYNVQENNIGGGSFGTVYKAYDNILDREVAIKVSEVKFVGDKEFSLLEEFKAIEHLPISMYIANYEGVFRFIERNGTYDYAVMQYYSLGNLSHYLKNNEVSLEKREHITIGILEGIAFLHQHKVVHRDLKPSNVLVVDRQGTLIPKITDFGLSKQAEADGKASRFTNSFAGGTLQYSSPEQLKGLPLKLNTDLWSFGAIAYEILTQKTLFEADSQGTASAEWQNAITQKILHSDVSKELESLSAKWRKVVAACLERDVNNRIQNTTVLFSILNGDENVVKEEVLEAQTIVKELQKTILKEETSATSNNDDTIIKGAEKKIKEIVSSKATSLSKTISKDKKKKLTPLVWLVMLLIVVAGVFFVLKPREPSIDPVVQKQFTSLKAEANLLAKRKEWKEALDKYQAANILIDELGVQDSISSIIKRLKGIAKAKETKFWESAKKSNTIKGYKEYLTTYQNGFYKTESDSAIASIEFYLKSEAGRKKLAQEQAAAKEKIEEDNKRLAKEQAATKKQEQERLALAKKKALEEELNNLAPALQKLLKDMVYVRGGSFSMGCTSEQGSDCKDVEKPSHQVTLRSFSIGKYEITQAQWVAVMGANPSEFSNCNNCPVEQVSWNDIQIFIRKLNNLTGKRFRLPTEAEWEFAARGGTRSKGYKYAGSNSMGSVAWYNVNSGRKTHPVGQKQSNELGLYDMSGNAWEWCSDWYGKSYYSNSTNNNPKGIISGDFKTVRGGSWSVSSTFNRISFRNLCVPTFRFNYIGFRLVSF